MITSIQYGYSVFRVQSQTAVQQICQTRYQSAVIRIRLVYEVVRNNIKMDNAYHQYKMYDWMDR